MSKASKSRPCPALGRPISSADCGEQRQSRLACPAECGHNPFTPENYSRLLEIEDQLDSKTSGRMVKLAPDPHALERTINRLQREGNHALHAFFVWHFFFEKDANGQTFAQRWEQAGLKELKNDERVLLSGKTQMRIALIEVHRVLGDSNVEAVDLLSPDPVPAIFQDRSLARTACRFSTLLAWVYPLPHFWRLSGTAEHIPDFAQLSAPEIVREIVRHLGGPIEELPMRRWLAEHFAKFHDSLVATSLSRRRLMFAGMDAKWGKAVYELRAPFAPCRNRLDELATVHPDDLSDPECDEGFAEARVWFDEASPGAQSVPSSGKPVLGRVLLGQSLWRLEAMGAERLARLRAQFEGHMGADIKFQRERLDDLAARLSAKEPAADESLVPPSLLEDPSRIVMTSSRSPAPPGNLSPEEFEQAWFDEANKAFLDNHVPALGNRTPREAARDPSSRPKLVEMMKERVRSCDEENLRTGRSDDINWMLKELGLNELIFEPPPWRPSPAPIENHDDLEEPGSGDIADPNRPPAPRLPANALTFEEASMRFEKAVTAFDTFAEAQKELAASGSTLLGDADELTEALLSEDDFSLAIPILTHAWFSLVPMGCRAPELDLDAMAKAFEVNLRQLEKRLRGGTQKHLESWLKDSAQPELMLVLTTVLIQSAVAAPKDIRGAVEAQPIVLALLKTIVEELDTVLRPESG